MVDKWKDIRNECDTSRSKSQMKDPQLQDKAGRSGKQMKDIRQLGDQSKGTGKQMEEKEERIGHNWEASEKQLGAKSK